MRATKLPTGTKPKGRSKYHAKPAIYDGIRYHSTVEARHAQQLDRLKAAGDVIWWLRQIPVRISPPGDEVIEVTRIDFLVCYRDGSEGGSVQGEEVKGVETREWKRVKRAWRSYGPFGLDVYRNGKRVESISPEAKGA